MLSFERASELCTLRFQQRNESLEILSWKRNSYPPHLFATINRVIKQLAARAWATTCTHGHMHIKDSQNPLAA